MEKEYLRYVNYYKEEMVKNNWANIKESLNKLYRFHDKNIVENEFMIIGPVDLIASIVPESAIKMLYDMPGTDFVMWYLSADHTIGYKVRFMGTDRVKETIATFLQEMEVPDNERESESTE